MDKDKILCVCGPLDGKYVSDNGQDYFEVRIQEKPDINPSPIPHIAFENSGIKIRPSLEVFKKYQYHKKIMYGKLIYLFDVSDNKLLPDGFVEFLKSCSDMELVAIQKEARECNDMATLNAVLIELGRRQFPKHS